MTQKFCDICGIPISGTDAYEMVLSKTIPEESQTVYGKCRTIHTKVIRKMDVCPSCANKIEGYVDYDINEIFEEKSN